VPAAGHLLASIPSPSTNSIHLGPLRLRAYGLLIALGVFAAVWLADRRYRARGGAPGTISALALWAVPGGLIGARIYHVITDYELYTHHLLNILKVWQGGLGIWGGIAGGVAGAAIYLHRHDIPLREMMDVVAPALPLAQAIGRWGNWFNQELFGRPTTLPWALQISPAHRPDAYARFATFQPTFLYESLWDLAVVALVLVIERRVRLRRGYLFAVYVALYTFGRFFTEYLRIDFAHKFLGLRLNDWVSVLVFATAATLVLVRGRAPSGEVVGGPVLSAGAADTATGDPPGSGDPSDPADSAGVMASSARADDETDPVSRPHEPEPDPG